MKNFLIKSFIYILWLFWLFCCSFAAYMVGQFTRDNWAVGWLFNVFVFIGFIFAVVSGCFTIEHFLSKYLDK
jgi:heme/copper-type cytochrome/quinol oxidase subunit 2